VDSQPVIKTTDGITICGMKGTGKSTWIREIAQNNQRFKQRVIVFDPQDEYRDQFETVLPESDDPEELDEMADYVFRQGNILLIVSEAEQFLPEGRPLPPHVFKLINRGRHRNSAIWADTRRIANLNKSVFNLSEHVIIFRHFGVTDINTLNKFVPDASLLRTVPDYHFIYYHRGKSTLYPPLRITEKRDSRQVRPSVKIDRK